MVVFFNWFFFFFCFFFFGGGGVICLVVVVVVFFCFFFCFVFCFVFFSGRGGGVGVFLLTFLVNEYIFFIYSLLVLHYRSTSCSMIPSCTSQATLPSSCSESTRMACAMSSSSGRVSLRSYASSNGSAYSRMPPSSPSSGALCDWMVTSNPHYRSMSSCGQITRRRRYRSSSRSRKCVTVSS